MVWPNQLTPKVPSMLIAAIRTLHLDSHIVHAHTTFPDVMHGLKRPYSSLG
jgi:hypothetical protein